MTYRDLIRKSIKGLPAISPVVSDIAKLMNRPDVSIEKIVKIIEYDPGMTANILRMANSPYFGGAQNINSIRQAIVRLGTKRLFDLAVLSAVYGIIDRPINGYNLPPGELWHHSVAVAIISRKLADHIGLVDPDTVFTAGLLHDIGKVVIARFVEEEFLKIDALSDKTGLSFEEAEKEVLGVDHAEVGSELLNAWDFPPRIVMAVRFHHAPQDLDRSIPEVDIVHIADMLSLIMGIGPGRDGLRYKLSTSIDKKYFLSRLALENIASNALDDMQNLGEFFPANGGI